jgi:hypothetical protein
MAHTWTRRELIDAALDALGVIVEGQSTPDELVAKVDKVLDPAMATLRVLDIVDVTAPAILGTPSPPANGEFPEELCLPLADWLAWSAAPKFNLAGDPALKALAIEAEDTLRRLTAGSRTRRMLRVDKALRSGTRRGRGSFSQGT